MTHPISTDSQAVTRLEKYFRKYALPHVRTGHEFNAKFVTPNPRVPEKWSYNDGHVVMTCKSLIKWCLDDNDTFTEVKVMVGGELVYENLFEEMGEDRAVVHKIQKPDQTKIND